MPEDENADSGDYSVNMSADEEPKVHEKKNVQERKPAPPNPEDKVRMGLLQSEKRFADLELSLAELRQTLEKFKDVDASQMEHLSELPDLKQRVGDLEDLVMVENAGIEELKDLMEGVRDRLQAESRPDAAATGQVVPENLKATIDEIESRISAIDDIKQHLDGLAHDIASMKGGMMTGPASPTDAGATQMFSAKLENLKAILDEMVKRKVEVDMKIERLDKNINMMQMRGSDSLPESLKKEIDMLNRNFSVIDSRIDAIENVSKNMSEEMQRARGTMQKFESFERASNLAKELQNKMEEFRFIENEVKRISNQVEGFYQNIDQRLDKMREFERLFPQMKEGIDGLRDELGKKMDESKIQILDRATKDETSAIRDRLSQMESKVSDSHLHDVEEGMEKLREDVKRGLSEAHEPMSVINIEMSDMMSRIIAIETRMGNLERMMQNAGKMQPIVLE